MTTKHRIYLRCFFCARVWACLLIVVHIPSRCCHPIEILTYLLRAQLSDSGDHHYIEVLPFLATGAALSFWWLLCRCRVLLFLMVATIPLMCCHPLPWCCHLLPCADNLLPYYDNLVTYPAISSHGSNPPSTKCSCI